MENAIERIKGELTKLVDDGIGILNSEVERWKKRDKGLGPSTRYQNWYTRALPVVRQLIPDRLTEFQEQYRLDKRKEIDASTYTISDYLTGLTVTRTRGLTKEEVFDSCSVFCARFHHQIAILQSAQSRIDSVLADIKGVLKANLFDSELEKASELLKKGHIRPAGTIAGVVLEAHLATVCENHFIKLSKRNPSISDYNDALKKAVYDTPTWRFIQRLGDIRNLCVHAKEREPTKEEIDELIVGVEKVAKTIF